MYNVVTNNTRSRSSIETNARDLDHAIILADIYKLDRDVTYIAIRRRNRVVSIVVDKNNMYNEYL